MGKSPRRMIRGPHQCLNAYIHLLTVLYVMAARSLYAKYYQKFMYLNRYIPPSEERELLRRLL